MVVFLILFVLNKSFFLLTSALVSDLQGEGYSFSTVLGRGEVDIVFSGVDMCFFGGLSFLCFLFSVILFE